MPSGAAPDPLVEHLLELGLIDAESIELVAELVRLARETPGLDLSESDLLGIAQALGRGAERVALASADAAAGKTAADPPDAWVERVAPLATQAFGVLFAHRLSRAMHRRHPASTYPAAVSLTVSFVDLRGSTGFMLANSADDIVSLADELYAVGQAVAARHEVVAGKFLGDGVLLVSRDPERLLSATTDAVAQLGERTPLRAGAGVARGDVVRHAGDWYGPPINLAARLAEVAAPDELLVDSTAARHGTAEWCEIVPRGLTEPRRVAVVAASSSIS